MTNQRITSEADLQPDELELLNVYRLCNDKGKERIQIYALDIVEIKRFTEPEDSQTDDLFLTGGIES